MTKMFSHAKRYNLSCCVSLAFLLRTWSKTNQLLPGNNEDELEKDF